MEYHSQNELAHHRLWQVQVTRQTQPPDYYKHVVVDAAHKDIRYLGSFSKKIEQTNICLQDSKTISTDYDFQLESKKCGIFFSLIGLS